MALDGKIAIVTGAGRGIGMAITKRLVADGAVVIGADIADDTVAAAAAIPGVVSLKADIATHKGISALVGAANERGGAAILVNNAGIVDRFLGADEMDDQIWDHVLAVNLTGPMRLMRAVLPGMLAKKRGAIVNIASVAGIEGGLAGAAYTASKHGLIGLTMNTAAMYGGDGIRCNAVAPGAINTGISIGGEPSPRGMAMLQTVMPSNFRSGEPDEIAGVVSFLVSPDASYVNGATLIVDGGWTAH